MAESDRDVESLTHASCFSKEPILCSAWSCFTGKMTVTPRRLIVIQRDCTLVLASSVEDGRRGRR